MAFIYTWEHATLTPSQESLLDSIENLPSPFSKISKLKDLRRLTGVSVVVSDRASLEKVLDDSIKRLSDQLEAYRNNSNYREIVTQVEREYNKLRWAKEQKKEASLLGLYSRKLLWFDYSSPTVYLFADNIKDYTGRIGTSADNAFGYVFIHEMMHAYYDAFNNRGYPSWEPLEEAFAEFGMLTFLNTNKLRIPVNLLAEAEAHVQSKIKHGPSEYGFGYDLYAITAGGDPEMINQYREISNWIDQKIIWSWASSNKYFSDINRYPGHVNANQCFNGVKEILEYPWKEPAFPIVYSILGSRSSSASTSRIKPSSSHVFPSLPASKQWSLTATQTGWHYHCPLIHKDDLLELLAVVMKVMKTQGFESYLSIAGGDELLFLGKPFSKLALSPATFSVIPEGLCVRGTTVFPAFKYPVHGPAGQVGKILHALSILFDGVFTLVHENAGYTLFGPGSCESLFSSMGAIVSSVPASTSKNKEYEIIDKTTSKVIGKTRGMPKTALFVVRDYCSRSAGISLADLQRVFARVPHHSSSGMSIVESDVNVNAYITSHPGDKHGPRYFVDAPIELTTGEIVLVSNQWGNTGKRAYFGVFKDVVEDLGYIIK